MNQKDQSLSLRQEIAKKIDDCMGYWEGITVPDHEQGYSSLDYADQVLKLIKKRIDELYPENPIDTQYKTGYYNAISDVKKELLK